MAGPYSVPSTLPAKAQFIAAICASPVGNAVPGVPKRGAYGQRCRLRLMQSLTSRNAGDGVPYRTGRALLALFQSSRPFLPYTKTHPGPFDPGCVCFSENRIRTVRWFWSYTRRRGRGRCPGRWRGRRSPGPSRSRRTYRSCRPRRWRPGSRWRNSRCCCRPAPC